MASKIREKAKTAGSAQELLNIAKAEGVAMTEEQAEELFDLFHPQTGELSDNELLSVSGGGCGGGEKETNYKKIHSTDPACIYYQCDRCKGGQYSHTATCRIAINALDPDSSGLGRLFYNTCYGCYYGDFGDSLDGYCWNENTKY